MKRARFRQPSALNAAVLLSLVALASAAACSKHPSLTLETVHGPLPRIDSIEHSAGDGVLPGEMVDFTLKGDPGLKASASLPGLAGDLQLGELSGQQGVYRGSLVIPQDAREGLFELIGRLEVDDRTASLQGPALRVRASDLANQEPVTPAVLNRQRVLSPVYFDFDRYELRPDAVETLRSNLDQIRRYSIFKVTLEGHCDERGTNEYNMSLGDKRANAVRTFLREAGVSALRLRTISYGEERPVDPGHSEEAWARNRRVEFVWID